MKIIKIASKQKVLTFWKYYFRISLNILFKIHTMKKIISILIISIILISSCSPTTDKDKKIISLNKKVEELTSQLENMEKKEETRKKVDTLRETSDENIEYEKLKKELEEKEELIAKLKIQVKSLIIDRGTEEWEIEAVNEKIEIPKEKILDIKFYSQAIRWNFKAPYQDFCEEASILNGYYYLLWTKPNLDNYDKDLWKMKKFEDENFKWWYISTSLQENVELLKAFQWTNQKVFAKIIENPTIEIIKENIAKWNPVVVPTYGKWLNNPYFTWEWPTYHNLLIKWYKDDIFITNEVWISKWDNFEYNQKLLIDNIFNYDPDLYPNRFKEGKKEIMVLYK